MTSLSVVICTFNRASLLQRLLEDLEAQKGIPNRLEVIVVDNHSTDSTQQVIRNWVTTDRFRFVAAFEKAQGHYAAARNAGLSHATGDIVAFLDDDVRVPSTWASQLIQSFDACPEAAGLGGPVEPEWEDGRPPEWVIPDLYVCIGIGDYGKKARFLGPKEFPIGANMAFRRNALLEVGGFDPRVGYMGIESIYNDEVELVTRMRAKGMKIFYDPKNVAVHLVSKSRMQKKYFIERRRIDGRSIAVVETIQKGKATLIRNLVLRSFIAIPRDGIGFLTTFFWNQQKHFVYSCTLAKTGTYVRTAMKILMGRSPVNLAEREIH